METGQNTSPPSKEISKVIPDASGSWFSDLAASATGLARDVFGLASGHSLEGRWTSVPPSSPAGGTLPKPEAPRGRSVNLEAVSTSFDRPRVVAGQAEGEEKGQQKREWNVQTTAATLDQEEQQLLRGTQNAWHLTSLPHEPLPHHDDDNTSLPFTTRLHMFSSSLAEDDGAEVCALLADPQFSPLFVVDDDNYSDEISSIPKDLFTAEIPLHARPVLEALKKLLPEPPRYPLYQPLTYSSSSNLGLPSLSTSSIAPAPAARSPSSASSISDQPFTSLPHQGSVESRNVWSRLSRNYTNRVWGTTTSSSSSSGFLSLEPAVPSVLSRRDAKAKNSQATTVSPTPTSVTENQMANRRLRMIMTHLS